jgi:hypothetical protein
MEYVLLLSIDFLFIYIKENTIVVCPSFKM